jgi:hypothetical protein
VKLLREALTDENGQGDIAYLAIGALTCAAIASLLFIFAMSTISYSKCQPITTISKGDQSVTSVIPCNFDPLPLGQAAGLVFGAFAALIGSLAGYMAATRKQRPAAPQVNAPGVQINQSSTQPQPIADPPVKPKARKKPRRR